MATTILIQNPVLEALAVIQGSLDEFPNPGDSDFLKCRSLTKSSKRCQTKIKESLLDKINALLSQFKMMAECPETDSFYKDMESFIRFTHCHRHCDAVIAAFTKWKNDLLAEADPVPPSASPTESPSTTIDTIFSPAASPSSGDTSQVSLSDGLICDEPASFDDLEEKDERFTRSITTGPDRNQEAVQVDQSIQEIDAEIDDATSYRDKQFEYRGLGFGSPRRTLSVRDHTPVLAVIQSHPSEDAMKIGTLYVREHSEAEGFFKIGYSAIGAEARLRQSKNCFRNSAKIIYESAMKFQGVKQAERIIHMELWNHNIRVSKCLECGGHHREWFKASKDKILRTVEKIERFVQMPSYIREDGEWKLTDYAYNLAYTMYGPKAINWRNGQGEDIATGRALDVIEESTPQTKAAATSTAATEENLQQESVPESPKFATEEIPATEVTPIKVAVAAAGVRVDVQVLLGENASKPDEVDEPRTMVIPLRPKPEKARGGIIGRGWRAVADRFRREDSVE
ncbi:hypothetical protein V8C26DRAFT_417195 [Trichoderma gracile]